ncbi:hypothetical protein HZQ14_15785 [Elizabethkingia anophelis]|nr:hypothetical protein [Elizabethkingia anophelis]
MKTKYIAVPVSERLPEKSRYYNTDQGDLEFSKELGDEFFFVDGPVLNVQWWLEEKEDHSEEMLSLLEDVKNKFKPSLSHPLEEGQEEFINQIEQLINKVKDNG